MSKEYELYLNDILEAVEKIEKYTVNLSFEKFSKNSLIVDAVIRNLEIIGEAVKNLPPVFKMNNPEIEWKKIAGLRDILIHEYFGVDINIIWDVIVTKLPKFKEDIKKL